VSLELLEGSELSAFAAYEHVFHRRQIQMHCWNTHTALSALEQEHLIRTVDRLVTHNQSCMSRTEASLR